MEITQVVLDAYNRDGIECELLNPNKQCKFRKGSIVKLAFHKMRTGKIQVYTKSGWQVYHQSFVRGEIQNFITPVDPEMFDLINYLIA